MNIGFYTAASGLTAFQQKLDVTANNIANINTYGYKQMNPSFRDLIYSRMNTKEEGHLVGHGTKVEDVDYVFTQGALERTNGALDYAIAGRGFFAVDTGGGQIRYTRDGAFRISVEGDGNFLTNQNGDYVLSGDGQRIEVPRLAGQTTIDFNQLYGMIGIYTFDNPDDMQPVGQNLLLPGDNTGQPTAVRSTNDNKLIRGVLETSSADTATEMVNMIKAQRAFQMNGRMVSTADQLEEMINNLR